MNQPRTTNEAWGPFTQAPNLLILMTDQQRSAQHLPAGWVENHLPNLWRLMQTGVRFPNAMTNASPCSPARGVLWTGTYPWVNGVTSNASPRGTSLSSRIGTAVKTDPNGEAQPLATLAQMLASLASEGVTYDIAYKGKWHLSSTYQRGFSAQQQQEAGNEANQGLDNADMEETYGFSGWTSPDFGTAVSVGLNNSGVNTLGGGLGGNDERVATGTSYVTTGTVGGASQYLTERFSGDAPTDPFCLVTSLLNPHDVWVSPDQYDVTGYDPAKGDPPWRQPPFSDIQALPSTYTIPQHVLNETKPQPQAAWRKGYDEEEALDYLRFYAYLETLSDVLLGEVLAALPDQELANTLIVRLADHGEMGMSQGGMVEKEAQAYNETLLVPMIFSNPGLPQGEECTGLAGLIDIVPTLAEICGLRSLEGQYAVQGTSLAPAILAGSLGTTYPQHLFQNPVSQVYALVDNQQYNAKYVITQNGESWQCELYDFAYDPTLSNPWSQELENRIPVNGLVDDEPASTPELQTLWRHMHTELTQRLHDNNGGPPAGTGPNGPPPWPAAPPPPSPRSPKS